MLLQFDGEQLPKRWMHPAVSGFPLLPPAQGAVDERGGGSLRKPGSIAGCADFFGRRVRRRASRPPVRMV